MNSFNIWEGRKDLTKDLVRSLIRGEYVAIIVRDYITESDCERIQENFINHPGIQQRKDIPAVEIGANSYGVTTQDYFLGSCQVMGDLWDLMTETSNPVIRALTDFQRGLDEGVALRPAIHKGFLASPFRAVSWTGGNESDENELALGLHEDVSQLSAPGLEDSEIAKIIEPIAINLYPSAAERGGELVIYDMKPNVSLRTELGLETTGYPYPKNILNDIGCQSISLDDGCLVLLRGCYIHGVRPSLGIKPRILLNSFVGAINADTYVYYT